MQCTQVLAEVFEDMFGATPGFRDAMKFYFCIFVLKVRSIAPYVRRLHGTCTEP